MFTVPRLDKSISMSMLSASSAWYVLAEYLKECCISIGELYREEYELKCLKAFKRYIQIILHKSRHLQYTHKKNIIVKKNEFSDNQQAKRMKWMYWLKARKIVWQNKSKIGKQKSSTYVHKINTEINDKKITSVWNPVLVKKVS